MRIKTVIAAVVTLGLVLAAAWSVASPALDALAEETGAAPPGADAAADPDGPASATGSADGNAQAAEGFEWFWAINGPVAADGGGDLSVDAQGNVFLAGGHAGLDMDQDGEVDFASGATVFVGANNPLFMKLNRGPSDDRVRLRWMRSPSTPADRSQTKIAADGRGGAYVIGAFMESVAFEDGPTLAGAGGNDAYVARYDPDGAVMWAKVFGGPGSDGAYGVATDADANVYVTGLGTGAFPLGDGAEFRAEAERAAVLVSYDPSGAVRWARMLGTGTPFAFNLRVSPDGVLYVTGELEGAADFDGDGVIDLPAPRDRDGFVAKFDTDGGFLDAWAVPAPAQVAFLPDGDVLLGSVIGGPVEQRYGPADFDGDGRAELVLEGVSTGAWVGRFSPGGERRWIRAYRLAPSDFEVRDGWIVVTGNYTGVPDIDEDGVPEPADRTVDPELETDLAILVIRAEDGRPERVWTAPGPGNDVASAVAFLPGESAVVVTGSIQITADFTGDGERGEGWVVCENRGDVFFAQYRLPGPLVEIPAEEPRGEEPPEEPEEIGLEAALAERDGRLEADLSWSGIASAEVDIYRKGALVATVPNDGTHTDVIVRNQVQRPYDYRVCAAGTTTCSPTVEATFPR